MSTITGGEKKRMYHTVRGRECKGFYNSGTQSGKQIWEQSEVTKRVESKNEREQQRQE